MRSKPRMRFVIVMCALLPACGSRTEQMAVTTAHPAADIAGCYRIASGDWESDMRINVIYPASRVPRLLHLDTARYITRPSRVITDAPVMFRVRTLDGVSAGRGAPYVYWQRHHNRADSIHIGEAVPLWGARLSVAPVGANLEGMITVYTDVMSSEGAPQASAPILLQRMPCPPRL